MSSARLGKETEHVRRRRRRRGGMSERRAARRLRRQGPGEKARLGGGNVGGANDVGERAAAPRQRRAFERPALEAEIERAKEIEPSRGAAAKRAFSHCEADERGRQDKDRKRPPEPMGEEPQRPEHQRAPAEAEFEETHALES